MSNKYQKFLDSYRGEDLLKNHSLNETGTWRIFGEDPNCDLGGPHVMPDLGAVEGRLRDVIDYAVELPSFWQWGAGGKIEKMKPALKINENNLNRIRQLKSERASLQDAIDTIAAELKELGAE